MTANRNSNDVSILLGTGTGTFGAVKSFQTGGVRPMSVAIGDFNGDGKSDLVVSNFQASAFQSDTNIISILLGDGSGRFGAATNFATGGQGPRGVAVGDFNADDKQDVAVVHSVSGNVSVLLGTGSGGFGTATVFPAGVQPISVAVADFNGDGNSDLVTADFIAGVFVLLGTGTGSFGAAIAVHPMAGASNSVAVGDFNGDGHQDAAAASGHGYVSILLGTGTGGFGAPTLFAMGTGAAPRSVVAADLNSDGRLDLATANEGSNTVSVLLSTCISSDTTSPVLTVPSTIRVTATSPAGAVVTYSVSASDNSDPNPVVSCAPLSGSTFPVGSTLVNCTATDASGNASSDSFTVNVEEAVIPPPDPAQAIQRSVALGVITSAEGIKGLQDLQGPVCAPYASTDPNSPDYCSPADDLQKRNWFKHKSNMELLKESGTRWVRLWADWPTLQPDNTPIDPNSSVLRNLDEQIKAARKAGIGVILTAYRFPVWVSYPAGAPQTPPKLKVPTHRVPDDLEEGGAWGLWIDFLINRYGLSETTASSGIYVDFLEVCNEPNMDNQMWPQRDTKHKLLVMPGKVAQMFVTAQKILRKHGNSLKLAGPATVDTTKGNFNLTPYQTFVSDLLVQLNLRGFEADEHFAWTHHNYGDVEYERDCLRQGRNCPLNKVNSAAWVRRTLVDGVRINAARTARWTGWPGNSQTPNPYILITEGGARLHVAYTSLRERRPGFVIRRASDLEFVKNEQGRLVEANSLRMIRGPLSQGIGMITNYLTYSDPCSDSGLYDTIYPIHKRELDCINKTRPEYERFYLTLVLGKRRPIYDRWQAVLPVQ